jgi:glycosyltransferase involved in cell wall biosynthesis
VVRQSILSLSEQHEIDYMGPEILDQVSRSKINKIFALKYAPGYISKIWALFRGGITGYYQSYLNELVNINWAIYDLVYLEFSRHAFIARQAKKNSKKIVVRVHNVEKDYHANQIRGKKSFQNSLRLLVKSYFIAKQESACLAYADCIICLTDSDKVSLKELYPASLSNKRLEVIPVSIEESADFSNPTLEVIENIEEKPYLLITGSLWFEPNVRGAVWFINKVWQRLLKDNRQIRLKYKLVIAGSRPGEELKAAVSRFQNIELVDTPPDMKPYFENASIYIAPIFSGAGMKVKVAEALAYGLPVIGTSHAFNGYRITDLVDGYLANDADRLINSLEHYMSLPLEAKRKTRINAYKNFLDYHSIEASRKSFQRIINNLDRS